MTQLSSSSSYRVSTGGRVVVQHVCIMELTELPPETTRK